MKFARSFLTRCREHFSNFSATWNAATISIMSRVPPVQDVLRQQLSRLKRVNLSKLPFNPLVTADHLDPRFSRQGSEQWFDARRGRLTASRFADVLGFRGQGFRIPALREWMDGINGDDYQVAMRAEKRLADAPPRDSGSQWGHTHERSALATYLTAFLLPRCPDAVLSETGFWPIDLEHAYGRLEMGASPDALLEGGEELFGPGGVVLEVKCPYGGGNPKAQSKIYPRQIPQLQGAMLATERSQCHLISWSPNGCSVFVVEANPSYQEAMVETLAVAANAASAERPLSDVEMTQAAQVRLWSRQLALDAHLLTTIASSQCVTAVDDQTAAEEPLEEAMADAPAAAAAGAYQRDPIAEAAQRAKEQFWGLLDRR